MLGLSADLIMQVLDKKGVTNIGGALAVVGKKRARGRLWTRSRKQVKKSNSTIFLLVHQSERKTNRALCEM